MLCSIVFCFFAPFFFVLKCFLVLLRFLLFALLLIWVRLYFIDSTVCNIFCNVSLRIILLCYFMLRHVTFCSVLFCFVFLFSSVVF